MGNMKSNVPHKKFVPPDVGYNINEYKYHVVKSKHRPNQKKYWLNQFNRRLRRFFNKLLKTEGD